MARGRHVEFFSLSHVRIQRRLSFWIAICAQQHFNVTLRLFVIFSAAWILWNYAKNILKTWRCSKYQYYHYCYCYLLLHNFLRGWRSGKTKWRCDACYFIPHCQTVVLLHCSAPVGATHFRSLRTQQCNQRQSCAYTVTILLSLVSVPEIFSKQNPSGTLPKCPRIFSPLKILQNASWASQPAVCLLKGGAWGDELIPPRVAIAVGSNVQRLDPSIASLRGN